MSAKQLEEALRTYRLMDPPRPDDAALLDEMGKCDEWREFVAAAGDTLIDSIVHCAAMQKQNPRGAAGELLAAFRGCLDGAFLLGYRTGKCRARPRRPARFSERGEP